MAFGGIILHGVYAYNCIAHKLLQDLGGSDAANLREFEAKFASVVRPGDQIRTCVGNEAEGGWLARVPMGCEGCRDWNAVS